MPASAVTSPAKRFSAEIEAALAEGYTAEDLTLRLTIPDGQRLLRDPNAATADIAFANGQMRYLGVLVLRDGVTRSVLRRPDDAEEAEPEPAPAKPKAKRRPKTVG